MHGGNDRDGLLGDIDPGKDGGGLADAGESLREELRWKVVEVEVDVILLLAHAAPRSGQLGQRQSFFCGRSLTTLKGLSGCEHTGHREKNTYWHMA